MKDEAVYLKHILDAVKKIESYTSGVRKTLAATPTILPGRFWK